jgi:hypothetical protein
VKTINRRKFVATAAVAGATFGQLRHHEVAAALEFFVTGTGESKSASRKVVSTDKMTAQFAIGLLPLAHAPDRLLHTLRLTAGFPSSAEQWRVPAGFLKTSAGTDAQACR